MAWFLLKVLYGAWRFSWFEKVTVLCKQRFMKSNDEVILKIAHSVNQDVSSVIPGRNNSFVMFRLFCLSQIYLCLYSYKWENLTE